MMLRTASGVSADLILGSTPVQVSVAPCEVKRRDAMPGYRGFVPGKKAETVFGQTFMQANESSHGFRPGPATVLEPEHRWNTADERPQKRRHRGDVAEWARL